MSKIRTPIRIVESDLKIELHTGIFGVYVLGGWDVVVDNFTFSLTNIKTGRIISPKVLNGDYNHTNAEKELKK